MFSTNTSVSAAQNRNLYVCHSVAVSDISSWT